MERTGDLDARRHRRMDRLALLAAVVGISSSAPLVVAFTGEVISIAFWRTALGAIATAPFAWRHRSTLRALAPRDWALMALSGAFLGLHFATWIPSLRYTTIAASIAITATQVVWAALLAHLAGHRAPRREWLGIGTALLGVTVLTGIDFGLDPRSLIGDGLALAAAMLAAAYMHVGQRVRTRLPATAYTAVVYAVAAVVLIPVLAALRVSPIGLSGHDWMIIIGVTVLAQLGGHSLMNQALRSFSATTVSLAILIEVPGATLLGWIWPGQTPPWQLLPAAVLILAGLVPVLRSGPTAPEQH